MNTEENLTAPEQEDVLHRKVGLPRFFELLGRDLWSFYQASFLCCLGFLPGFVLMLFGLMAGAMPLCVAGGVLAGVVGAPFLCGLLDTVLRALRDEPGYWWHTYKKAWRQNWKESLLPGLAFGVFFGLWISLIFLLTSMESVPISVWTCLVVGLFLGLGYFGYLFAQIPLVSLPLGQLIKNAALMFLGFFPRTLAATLVMAGYWGLVLFYMPYTIPVVFVTGFWLPTVISMMILYPGLDKVFSLEKTIRERREAEINRRMAASQPIFDDRNDQ
ncbi:MAG: DUF624 domain-containing protein [Gemmiger sp.]